MRNVQRRCPCCGVAFETMGAKLVRGEIDTSERIKPQPGDVTICGACGTLMRVDAQGESCQLNRFELAQFAQMRPDRYREAMRFQASRRLRRRPAVKAAAQ